ncbi:CGNR zinc finger domain-containing protein [Streptomonospora sp. S1-112]|uniref:CGNR zinc finger domain-containing protein n=1 Tax=Streptomonospora mangrovi TaxID=2883123 RepID=A0A9X3NL73_9ACTN|nr:CGNR zinc finger domain-containing protein [Streptomonospora mangrovi]MDA0565532.1 CGNR zinc finger domain-containing protein [Streptomonospora mangrovi]
MPETIADLLPEEPLPVRLMNTVWADRHGRHDDLADIGGLRAWLRRTGLVADPAPTAEDLAAFRRLRAAARRVAAHVTADDRPPAGDPPDDLGAALADLNADCAACSPRLIDTGDGLALRWHPGPRDTDRARAELALAAARLFSGEDAGLLRACYGPGCVLYFRGDHPRREWCSAGCGNRARVARHYSRHRPRRRD